jgi:hypothetical protein
MPGLDFAQVPGGTFRLLWVGFGSPPGPGAPRTRARLRSGRDTFAVHLYAMFPKAGSSWTCPGLWATPVPTDATLAPAARACGLHSGPLQRAEPSRGLRGRLYTQYQGRNSIPDGWSDKSLTRKAKSVQPPGTSLARIFRLGMRMRTSGRALHAQAGRVRILGVSTQTQGLGHSCGVGGWGYGRTFRHCRSITRAIRNDMNRSADCAHGNPAYVSGSYAQRHT